MKALYVHSFRLERTADGKVYSRFGYSQRWGRYLRHFSALRVVCRMRDVREPSHGMQIVSGPRVSFVATRDDHGKTLASVRTRATRKAICEAICDCNAVIIRTSRIGWMAAQAAEARGIPWAVEVVGDAWEAVWNCGRLVGKVYAPVAWFQARRWIRRAPFAVYVTRECLQGRYPSRGIMGTASNVDIDPVEDCVLRRRLLRDQTLSEWPVFRCGVMGDLYTRYKGLHVALRAIRCLRAHGINLHLYVLGAGHLDRWRREADEMGVGGLLHLEGCLPSGERVMQWLDELQLYIQPSLSEGLPRATIEAMSRGLPVLGSKCGGIPELLGSDCLHNPGDHRKLAEHMQRMMRDGVWRVGQARRNFEAAKAYYRDVLELRRDAFWGEFAAYVRSRCEMAGTRSRLVD